MTYRKALQRPSKICLVYLKSASHYFKIIQKVRFAVFATTQVCTYIGCIRAVSSACICMQFFFIHVKERFLRV